MSYELRVIHPVAATWLTDHDYTYEHEVYMPDYGRADFVAVHDDGHMLILECKVNCKGLSRAITQVTDYGHQYNPSAMLAIGVPEETIDSAAVSTCGKRSIKLIGFDVPAYNQDRDSNDGVKDLVREYMKMRDELWEFQEAYAASQDMIAKMTNVLSEAMIVNEKSLKQARYALATAERAVNKVDELDAIIMRLTTPEPAKPDGDGRQLELLS
jgi:hypothetical protein